MLAEHQSRGGTIHGKGGGGGGGGGGGQVRLQYRVLGGPIMLLQMGPGDRF